MNDKCRSFSQFAFHANCSVMVIYDSPCNREPKAVSALPFRSVKGFEYSRQIVCWNSLPRIAYFHSYVILVARFIDCRPPLPIAFRACAALQCSMRSDLETIDQRPALWTMD